MIESWSFNVLFLDQIKSEKKRKIKLDLFSFSFIFLFSFHEVENVHEVGCTSPPPPPWLGADLNLVNRNTPIFAYYVTSSNDMPQTERKKLQDSDFKKVFLLNEDDKACWVATSQNVKTNKAMKYNISLINK